MSYIDLTNTENYVLQIQRMLRDINYYTYDDASLGITGIYDTPTRIAVMRFQEDMGIKPSGKTDIESGMVFRRDGIPMGIPGLDEWHIPVTGEENVRAARLAVDA